MNTKIKIALVASSLLLSSSMLLNSCKKSLNKDSEIVKNEVVAVNTQDLKDKPLTSVEMINLSGKGFYGDIDGNRITNFPDKLERGGLTSCPNPGESEFSQTLLSISHELTCGQGYRFEIKYKLISEFTPLTSISATQISFGRIRLKNASGTQIYVTPTTIKNPIISIVDNGVVAQNSNNEDMNEFIITYRTEYVPEITYSNAASIEASLFLYTDCPNYATQQIPFSPQQAGVGYQQNTLPCTRIDKMYWGQRMGNTPPYLSGTSPLCCGNGCFPYGYVYPAKQQIEYRVGNTNTWKAFRFFSSGLTSGTSVAMLNINYFDFFYIDVPNSQLDGLIPGNVQVRYRNNHNVSNNGGPCVSQPTGIYAFETWLIN